MTNRIRPALTIPNELLKGLSPTLASALNDSFRRVAELHEKTAGLRGSAKIAPQTLKDQRGQLVPGLTLSDNRIASVADPVDSQDALTLGQLRRDLACENLTRILEECSDYADLLGDEAADVDGSEFGGPNVYIVGMPLWAYSNFTATSTVGTINTIVANLFECPYKFHIDTMVIEATTTSVGTTVDVGWYNGERERVWSLGGMAIETNGVHRIGINIDIEPGMYFQAWTAFKPAASPPAFRCIDSVSANWTTIMNSGSVRVGIIAAGASSGVLPNTLGTMTTPTTQHQLFALFEVS